MKLLINYIMKKQLLVLLFLFSAVVTYSQHTITGVVTSSEDGMPETR